MHENEYLKKINETLKRFDDLDPKDGREANIKNLANLGKLYLQNIQEDQEKLDKIFLNKEGDLKRIQKRANYPFEVGLLHSGISTGFGTVTLTGIFLGIAYYLGGPDISLWSGPLMWIGAGLGTFFAAPVAIASNIIQRKSFNSAKPKFYEKRAIKRARDKQMSLSKMASKQNRLIDEIVEGKYKLTETKQVQKGKKIVTKKVLKEEFKNLPWFTKFRLKRILSRIEDNNSKLAEAYSELEARTKEKVTLSSANKMESLLRKITTSRSIEAAKQAYDSMGVELNKIRENARLANSVDAKEALSRAEELLEEGARKLEAKEARQSRPRRKADQVQNETIVKADSEDKIQKYDQPQMVADKKEDKAENKPNEISVGSPKR